MNNFILKHNLTNFIENQQKRKKLPATAAAPAVSMTDDVPSTSTDPPPVPHSNTEDVDMYSDLETAPNTLFGVGYDPEYPQCDINPSLAINNPPADEEPISLYDINTPPPNSPQEWTSQVTDQIDQLDPQGSNQQPQAILEVAPTATPPPSPPADQACPIGDPQ